MTPEQQAFYEYGRAVESLRGTIYKIRKNAIHEFGEPYYRLMMHEQKCLINAMGLASKIHAVRQKRVACRLWNIPNHERICGNCKFWDCLVDEHPCSDCNSHNHNKWEPRED